jgi:hypothetical protein
MSKCGLTVTGTRTRYECFLRQLKSYGLVIYNTLHKLFYVKSDTDIRTTIKKRIQNPVTMRHFIEEINKKCIDISLVIQSSLTPYIHLMGLEQRHIITNEHVDYVPDLWTFFIRIIYEKPALLLPDSLEGDNVLYIQESFQWFISEQVKTIRPKKTEELE